MRKEIEFHKFFLPQKPKTAEKNVADINYLSYSKVIDFAEKSQKIDEQDKQKEVSKDTKKSVTPEENIIHNKNINYPIIDTNELNEGLRFSCLGGHLEIVEIMIENSKKLLEAEKIKMIEEAKKEIVSLVIKATEKLLDDKDTKKYDDKILSNIENI
jgi:hypothetical protein